jgi:hypothetical protein
MKNNSSSESTGTPDDDLEPEYRFDYRKAKPNRFAAAGGRVVVLDEDIAKVFTTPEAVNRALRAFIEAMPPATKEPISS